MEIINKISKFLNETATVDNPSFDYLIDEIKSRFGDDSIIDLKQKGTLLIVRMLRLPYLENQHQFELPTKQEWINDKGFSLVSVHTDFEPTSIKLYFCKNEDKF